MKRNLFVSFALGAVALAVVGCSSSTPETTAAEKKAFMGHTPPKDYMKNIVGGAAAGKPAGAPKTGG